MLPTMGAIRAVVVAAILVSAGGCAFSPVDDIVLRSAIPNGPPDPYQTYRLPGGYDEALRDADALGPARQERLKFGLLQYLRQSYGGLSLTEAELNGFAWTNGFRCRRAAAEDETWRCLHNRRAPFRTGIPWPSYRRVEIVLSLRRHETGRFLLQDIELRLP